METKPIKSNTAYKIGTRGSDLALWQARQVDTQLEADTEITIIKTSGDRFQDIPLQGQSQVGFFTREIENRLLKGEIDIAVHSLKDLPTKLHPGLQLGAYLPRGVVNDLILIHPDWYDKGSLIPVKPGCQVGATSLRRQSLLHLYAPQATSAMLRGNVPTRVEKCRDGQYGAIILAQAGIERLQLDISPLLVFQLNPVIWLPAPGQGVVSVQIRQKHHSLLEKINKLDDQISRNAATIERHFLTGFEGGCHTAFGAYAQPVASNSQLWNTWVGIDQPGSGWGQAMLENRTLDELTQMTPADIEDFMPLKLRKQEELCTRIHW